MRSRSEILIIEIPRGLGFILSDVVVILSVILSDGVVTGRSCDSATPLLTALNVGACDKLSLPCIPPLPCHQTLLVICIGSVY
jgi:hypothetical protein